jgi:hypothetical protein
MDATAPVLKTTTKATHWKAARLMSDSGRSPISEINITTSRQRLD